MLLFCCASQKKQVINPNHPCIKLAKLKKEIKTAPDSLHTYIQAKIDALEKACEYSGYIDYSDQDFINSRSLPRRKF